VTPVPVPSERSLISGSIAVAVLDLVRVLVAVYALVATIAVIILAARFGIERLALGHIRVRHFGSIAVTIAESRIAAKGSLRVASLVSGIVATAIDSPTAVNPTRVVNSASVINSASVVNTIVGVAVVPMPSLIILVDGRIASAIAAVISPIARAAIVTITIAVATPPSPIPIVVPISPAITIVAVTVATVFVGLGIIATVVIVIVVIAIVSQR
jgi:hypothetical protein